MNDTQKSQIAEIKRLRQDASDKLVESLSGIADSKVPGPILNQQAPCLISHVVGDLGMILHIIDELESAL